MGKSLFFHSGRVDRQPENILSLIDSQIPTAKKQNLFQQSRDVKTAKFKSGGLIVVGIYIFLTYPLNSENSIPVEIPN